MATQLQIRRGSDSQVSAFTGAEGEIVVNTTNDSIHVNDGSTAGGFELARVDGSNWNVTNNISTTGSLTAASLVVDTTTLVVDATNNRVGIGSSSPDAPLEIDGGSTDNTVLHLTSGTANTFLKLSDSNTSNGGFIGYTTEDMTFFTNNTERMRIDSSGNVGIGNSSPLGRLTISNAAGTNAPTTVTAANTYLQLGSDDYGPSNNGKFMIGFGYTDAINTNSPAYIGYEEVSTSGDTYGDLTFYTRSVNTDTAPTERMRILSTGGITFNGDTAQANALDDYEEGTWTPTYYPASGSFTTITYDGQTGHYVKVGALVTAWCYLRTGSLDTTGASGAIQVAGFPFAANADSGVGTGSISAQDAWTTRMPTITWVDSSSRAALAYGDDTSTSYNSISVSNMTTGTSKNRLYAVWSYETTS